MKTPLTIECEVHFDRRGRGFRKELKPGEGPRRPAEPGRVPRIARLMALAIRCEGLIREGVVESYAELARLGHFTRARVRQIMNLLNLAPDIQEEILFLPRTESGRDAVILAQRRRSPRCRTGGSSLYTKIASTLWAQQLMLNHPPAKYLNAKPKHTMPKCLQA